MLIQPTLANMSAERAGISRTDDIRHHQSEHTGVTVEMIQRRHVPSGGAFGQRITGGISRLQGQG